VRLYTCGRKPDVIESTAVQHDPLRPSHARRLQLNVDSSRRFNSKNGLGRLTDLDEIDVGEVDVLVVLVPRLVLGVAHITVLRTSHRPQSDKVVGRVLGGVRPALCVWVLRGTIPVSEKAVRRAFVCLMMCTSDF
jgi:hypothetical protein